MNHQLLLAFDAPLSQPKEMSRPKKLEQLEKNFFDCVDPSFSQHKDKDLTSTFKREILQKSFVEAKQTINLIEGNRNVTATSLEQIEIFTNYAKSCLEKMASIAEDTNTKVLEKLSSRESIEATLNELLRQAKQSLEDPD